MFVNEEARLHAGEEMTPRGRLVGEQGRFSKHMQGLGYLA